MTELLSKEKEFLELNEQLNRIATNVMEHHGPQQEHNTSSSSKSNSAGSSNAPDTRFLTYQKAKGQSTLSKQRGAGDGISEVMNAKTRTTITTNRGERVQPTASSRGSRGETYRQNRQGYVSPTSPIPVAGGNSAISTTMPKYRHKPITNSESSRSQTHHRFSNSRLPGPTNTSTFTVKYRNPKFVESPSLEVLVRDECSTVKCQKATPIHGSVSSIDGCSTGRRSQTGSNNTFVTKKNISTDGLIKFLKSKITIFEEDHDRISKEMSQQKELLDKALERTKLIEQQRDQALAKHNATSEQLRKVEAQLDETNQRLKERSLEYTAQQKELETVKRELKILTQNNNNLEKRLYRANEDLENARSTITIMKNSERDLKESSRIESESKDKQIKSLKKQRADLLNAYKKQLFLIDNLKRQNICMEQSKMIAFGEKEFSKVLEWNMKS